MSYHIEDIVDMKNLENVLREEKWVSADTHTPTFDENGRFVAVEMEYMPVVCVYSKNSTYKESVRDYELDVERAKLLVRDFVRTFFNRTPDVEEVRAHYVDEDVFSVNVLIRFNLDFVV